MVTQGVKRRASRIVHGSDDPFITGPPSCSKCFGSRKSSCINRGASWPVLIHGSFKT